MREGVSAPLLTVFPSQTWPAHASLLTGTQPSRHGVLGNHLWSREKRKTVHAWQLPQHTLMKGDTLYDAAHRVGAKTANVFWPNTGNAKGLDWNVPEVYGSTAFRRQSSKGALRELKRLGLPTDRLNRISYEEAFEFDSFARDSAREVMQQHRPDLMMVHLLTLDTLSHRYGPDSRPAGWGLWVCDVMLGQLLRTWKKTGGGAVVVVSDHGFTQVKDGLGVRLVRRAAKLTTKEKKAVKLVANGHNLYIYADPSPTGARALGRLKAHFKTDERLDQWFEAADMKRLHLGDPTKQPWLPDAIAMMKPEVLIWGTRSKRRERRPVWRGNHGHLPETAGLAGVFIAAGPGFRAGLTVPQLHVIDVAPTLGHLFGWPLRGTIDGRVRAEVLRNGPSGRAQEPTRQPSTP